MDIFESLENLNVSEGCFDEIVGIVEEIIHELNDNTVKKVEDARDVALKSARDSYLNTNLNSPYGKVITGEYKEAVKKAERNKKLNNCRNKRKALQN